MVMEAEGVLKYVSDLSLWAYVADQLWNGSEAGIESNKWSVEQRYLRSSLDLMERLIARGYWPCRSFGAIIPHFVYKCSRIFRTLVTYCDYGIPIRIICHVFAPFNGCAECVMSCSQNWAVLPIPGRFVLHLLTDKVVESDEDSSFIGKYQMFKTPRDCAVS